MKNNITVESGSNWNNISWYLARMDYHIMELFIQKFLDVFHISKMNFDICQDLYAEILFEIYMGKEKFIFAPSDFMLRKKIKQRLSNFHRDNDHRNKKLMQQFLSDV